ncbi:MAG: hypothetical protein QY323_01350 [Patescibacteria group bacterium]|nr:MAG: hypothetical protein QY323_01350 [Patescibacteria group bacterium]
MTDPTENEQQMDMQEPSWKDELIAFLSSPPILKLLSILESKSDLYLEKMTEEISKETWRFSKEEKHVKEVFEKVLSDNKSLLLQGVSSFRSFLTTLVGFSLTIIGFTASGLGQHPDADKSPTIGLLLLVTSVVLGVLDILFIHLRDNRRFGAVVRWQKDAQTRILKQLKETHDQGRSFDAYLKEKMSILSEENIGKETLRDKIGSAILGYAMPILTTASFAFGAVLIAMSYIGE